jgi:hypothetical protein
MIRALTIGVAVLALIHSARAADDAGGGSGSGSGAPGTGSGAGSGSGSSGDDTTADCVHSPDPAQCLAGKADALPDFDKIRSPDSPAFTLLGVTPTQIDRPTTPKQIATSLSGFVSDGGVAIPKNLAVEFWPYWLFSHPTLTAGQYQDRSRAAQFVENITISIGTANSTRTTSDMASHTDANLAIGARTLVNLSAQPVIPCKQSDYDQLVAAAKASMLTDAPDAQSIIQQLQVAHLDQQVYRDKLDVDRKNHDSDAVSIDEQRLGDDAKIIATLEGQLKTPKGKLNAGIASQLDKLCTDGSQEARQGFVAEFAVASSELFLDSEVSDHHYGDTAAWTTIAWESPGWSVMALGRYLTGKVIGADRNRFVDTGARLIRSKDTYALSVELLGRFPIDTPSGSTLESTYRVDMAVDYHVQDNTWLTLSFGKDFSQSTASSFFSLANLKIGLGDPKLKPPSQAASK